MGKGKSIRPLSKRFPGGQVDGAQHRNVCTIHEDLSTEAAMQLVGWETFRKKSILCVFKCDVLYVKVKCVAIIRSLIDPV